VQAFINDQGPFEFALDTGISRTILSSELAGKLAIETSEDNPVTGGGIGGETKIVAGKVRSLAVGNAVVSRPRHWCRRVSGDVKRGSRNWDYRLQLSSINSLSQ
jgi:Aspartyl protease